MDNYKLRNSVIIDCVNPLPMTRKIWQETAKQTNQELISIELTCSDQQLHRQRIKERENDIDRFIPPSWDKTINRNYVPWNDAIIKIDTSIYNIEQAVQEILSYIHNHIMHFHK